MKTWTGLAAETADLSPGSILLLSQNALNAEIVAIPDARSKAASLSLTESGIVQTAIAATVQMAAPGLFINHRKGSGIPEPFLLNGGMNH